MSPEAALAQSCLLRERERERLVVFFFFSLEVSVKTCWKYTATWCSVPVTSDSWLSQAASVSVSPPASVLLYWAANLSSVSRCWMGRLYWDETRVFNSSCSILAAILLVCLSLLLHIQRRRFIGDTAAGIPPCCVPASSLSVCLSPPFLEEKEEVEEEDEERAVRRCGWAQNFPLRIWHQTVSF